MSDEEMEGTTILERLAEIGGVDGFLSAVDADDAAMAARWMRRARIDAPTIRRVLHEMMGNDDVT